MERAPSPNTVEVRAALPGRRVIPVQVCRVEPCKYGVHRVVMYRVQSGFELHRSYTYTYAYGVFEFHADEDLRQIEIVVRAGQDLFSIRCPDPNTPIARFASPALLASAVHA